MKDWEDLRKKISRSEAIVLSLCGAILLIGIVCDIFVKQGNTLFWINEFGNLALVLLQIQATMSTLAIAIIALLSGNIYTSYMGVSVGEYYLEKRPIAFRVKRVVIAESIFILISVMCCMGSMYNTVVALFIASLSIVFKFVLNVLLVFRKRSVTILEIEYYVSWLLSKDDDYISHGKFFVEDWKKDAKDQSSEEFQKFQEFFMVLIKRILSSEESLADINFLASNIISFLLKTESRSCVINGIKLTESFYTELLNWARVYRDKAKLKNGIISVFDRVKKPWMDAVSLLDMDTIENDIHWKVFSFMVIKSSIQYGNGGFLGLSEKNAVYGTASAFGRLIVKLRKRGEPVGESFWIRAISTLNDYNLFIRPEEEKELFFKVIALQDFYTCYGYLINDQVDIVKKAIFNRELESADSVKNSGLALRVMLVHCFMYYLSLRKPDSPDNRTDQYCINTVLYDPNTINAVCRFLFVLKENKSVITNEIEEILEDTLEMCEVYPKIINGIRIDITRVVRDYYLYIVLCLHGSFWGREQLSNLLDTYKYKPYLQEYQEQKLSLLMSEGAERTGKKTLRHRLIEIEQLFNAGREEESNASNPLDDMLSEFEIVMKKKVKDEELQSVKEFRESFDKRNRQKEYEEQIKEEISAVFEPLKDLKPIPEIMLKSTRMDMFRLTTDIRWMTDDDFKIITGNVLMNYSRNLFKELIEWHKVKVYGRDEKDVNRAGSVK